MSSNILTVLLKNIHDCDKFHYMPSKSLGFNSKLKYTTIAGGL